MPTADMLNPVCVRIGDEQFPPEYDYGGGMFGPVRLRTALRQPIDI